MACGLSQILPAVSVCAWIYNLLCSVLLHGANTVDSDTATCTSNTVPPTSHPTESSQSILSRSAVIRIGTNNVVDGENLMLADLPFVNNSLQISLLLEITLEVNLCMCACCPVPNKCGRSCSISCESWLRSPFSFYIGRARGKVTKQVCQGMGNVPAGGQLLMLCDNTRHSECQRYPFNNVSLEYQCSGCTGQFENPKSRQPMTVTLDACE